jgi:VCBS repeat-containing protein
VDDPDYTVGAGGLLTVDATTGVLANDDDPDGDDLTVTNATEMLNGDLTLTPDGSFTYTPDDGFTGPDTFTYQASDGQDVSNTATVTITVGP